MRKAIIFAAACLFSLAACGPASVRVYKGTSTSSTTANGATNTLTTTGAVFNVEPGSTADVWVFLDNTTAYTATLANGTSLTFQGGQGYSETQTNPAGMQSLTISTGTGTMTPEQLSLNVTGTITSGAATATYSLTFTGNRQ